MANPNPNLLTRPVIKKGSKGVDVKFAQKQLKVYMPSEAYLVVVDGDFGDKTDAAVKAFQNKCGITADGIIGDATWKRLGPQVNSSLIEHYSGYKKTSFTEVQRLLKLGGKYSGDLDGIWGVGSENGVKNFQKAYGLTQDGIWGMQCWSLTEGGFF